MEEIKKLLEKVVKKLFDVKADVNVAVAPENTGADYASNVAMQLAKVVHRNPMVIAESIVTEVEGLSSPRITSSEPAIAPSPDIKSGSVRCSALPRTSSEMTAPDEMDEVGDGADLESSQDCDELRKLAEGLKVEVATPGFLNFTVKSDEILAKAKRYAEDLRSNISQDEYEGKLVVAEFSDPNPFKVLHVGHLYTSVVGDSISRLIEFAGGKVVRANFGGDVGLHVAKTLYSLAAEVEDLLSGRTTLSEFASAPSPDVKSGSVRSSALSRTSSEIFAGEGPDDEESRVLNSSRISSPCECPGAANLCTSSEISAVDEKARDLNSSHSGEFEDLEGEKFQKLLERLTIEDIARCYVEGTRAYDEDGAAKAKITALNKEIYRINEEDLHDSALAQLYWRGRELSYEYFKDFYARIGLKFDKFYPESSVVERGLKEVRVHTGTVYEESDGAVVYKGEKVGLHTRVFINSEGVPTYEAKDVGLIFTKWDDWHFDESIVITGNEQTDYMRVVLASVSEYAPQLVDRTRHLTHGLVKLPGGVKMSSRKGNFLKAVDVLELVAEQLRKNPTGNGEVDDKVLLAAIKYAFLKYKMGGDIVFDLQESVSMTGNSGVYLLYSAVRAKKILQKKDTIKERRAARETDAEYEKSLSKKIVQYTDVLHEAVREKAPYKVCTYLYDLAQEFSRFYEHVKVAGSENEDELMTLVQAYLNVMEHGLELLGIQVPEEM